MTRLRLTVAAVAALLLLGIGVALSQSITTTSDVQIVARKLDDGRIEFGLEQDDERILPRVRYFPADAPVDRWLKSSAISVDVPAPTAPDAPEPTDESSAGDTDADTAALWVVMYADRFGRLEVTLQSAVDLPRFAIDVIVAAGGRSWTLCNADPLVAHIPTALSCASPSTDHSAVTNVAAVIEGQADALRFACRRHDASTESESVWACDLRE